MFVWSQLLVMLACTIIPFFWVFNLKSYNGRLYFGIILFFFFVYAGIGGGLDEVSEDYWLYYLVYSTVLSLGAKLTMGKEVCKGRTETTTKLIAFIDRYGRGIIITYFLCHIALLIYPEFNLFRLVSPPKPDLIYHFSSRLEEKEINLFQSVLYYLIETLKPFFFFSLFKYRKAPIKLFILLLMQPYITYCTVSYLGRSDMMIFIFVFLATVYKWRPDLRKLMLIAILIIMPSFIIFLLNYASIRQGAVTESIDFVMAVTELFKQETSFPLWFDNILKYRAFSFDFMLDYFVWLFTLPLPGFLKGSGIDYDQISELLLGVSRYAPNFNIVLPGVVGESVFVFGSSLFWIHGFMYGAIAGLIYNLLKRHEQFDVLLFFSAFMLSYMINRGYTGAGYPFAFKHLFVFCVIIFLYSRTNLSNIIEKFFMVLSNRISIKTHRHIFD